MDDLDLLFQGHWNYTAETSDLLNVNPVHLIVNIIRFNITDTLKRQESIVCKLLVAPPIAFCGKFDKERENSLNSVS